MRWRNFWKKLSALSATILSMAAQLQIAEAKLDCGPTVNKSIQLPRTIAIGTNPAGTGAHALASGLAAIASKATQVSPRCSLTMAPMRGCRY